MSSNNKLVHDTTEGILQPSLKCTNSPEVIKFSTSGTNSTYTITSNNSFGQLNNNNNHNNVGPNVYDSESNHEQQNIYQSSPQMVGCGETIYNTDTYDCCNNSFLAAIGECN